MRDNSKQVRPETLGTGVLDPKDYQIFSADDEMVIGVYADGVDIRHVIVRNFEPGQENPLHVHPENGHCIYILEGIGEVFYADGPPVPIKAGQIWIVPAACGTVSATTGAHGSRTWASPPDASLRMDPAEVKAIYLAP